MLTEGVFVQRLQRIEGGQERGDGGLVVADGAAIQAPFGIERRRGVRASRRSGLAVNHRRASPARRDRELHCEGVTGWPS